MSVRWKFGSVFSFWNTPDRFLNSAASDCSSSAVATHQRRSDRNPRGTRTGRSADAIPPRQGSARFVGPDHSHQFEMQINDGLTVWCWPCWGTESNSMEAIEKNVTPFTMAVQWLFSVSPTRPGQVKFRETVEHAFSFLATSVLPLVPCRRSMVEDQKELVSKCKLCVHAHKVSGNIHYNQLPRHICLEIIDLPWKTNTLCDCTCWWKNWHDLIPHWWS